MFNRIFKPKWQHPDTQVREAELARLEYATGKEAITTMALSDDDTRIRRMALAKIDDQESIQTILSQTTEAADWLAVATRLLAIAPNTYEALVIAFSRQRQVWNEKDLITAIGQIGESLLVKSFVASINNEPLLLQILFASKSLELRLQIIEQISQPDSLQQLLKKVTHKQLLQAIRLKLKQYKQQQEAIEAEIALAEKLVAGLSKLSRQQWDGQFDAQLTLTEQKWSQINTSTRQAFEEAYLIECEKCRQVMLAHQQEVEAQSRINQHIEKQQALIDQLQNITRELTEESQSSHHPLEDALRLIDKNWQQINREIETESVENGDARLVSRAKAQFQELKQKLLGYFEVWNRFEILIPKLHELFEQNPQSSFDSLRNWLAEWEKINQQLDWPKSLARPQRFQQWEHAANTHRKQLADLKQSQKKKAEYLNHKLTIFIQHIRQKNLIAANKMFNYMEHEKLKLSGNYLHQFEQKMAKRLPDLEELRDWHAFATTPKKIKLCETMESLADKRQSPLKRAEAVRKIQQDWQALNASDSTADQALWDRFQAASEKAFEPCLAYYAEQDTIKAQNLTNRLALCEQLECIVANTDWRSVDWKALDKLQQQIKQNWQQNAPVPQSEHKAALERFNRINAVIGDKLKAEKQANLDAREILIEKAKKLDALDDLDTAIDKAKALQQEWKHVGLTFYQADRNAWQKFRQATNKIFEKRGAAKQAFIDELKNNQVQLQTTTQKIIELTALDDQSLKSTYQAFEQLVGGWDKSKSLPRATAKKCLAAYHEACEKYKSQYAGIAARAFQQTFKGVQILVVKFQQAEKLIASGESTDLSGLSEQISLQGEIPRAVESLSRRLDAMKCYSADQDFAANETEAKRLTLQAEIVAGIESPAEFKSARMAMQLEQLQQGLSASDNSQSKKDKLLELYFQWIAIGFLSEQTALGATKRFDRVLESIK